MAPAPNQRWATVLCRIWAGKDGWCLLALVISCHTRELLGWHLSRSGKSKTADAALEQTLITRFGCLGLVTPLFLLRSDNGLVFTSRNYTALVKIYGLQQEYITPYTQGKTGDPDTERAMCASAEVRDVTTRQSSNWRQDFAHLTGHITPY
ncbi:DDE-type integrase/transposase/recombinase [Aeromonas jandaei]